jgi:hypothetical protein
MSKKESKYKNLLKDLNIIDDVDNRNTAEKLLERPIKDSAINTPHTTCYTANYIYQADSLFLPEDTTVVDEKREKEEFKKVNKIRVQNKETPFKKQCGYRYLLVVIDIATSKIDVEPYKYKYAFIVRDCLKRIFKRKILKEPYLLEVDAGKEFAGDFKDFFEKRFQIRVKQAGRHRQQAVVEGMNSLISKVIQTRMLSEELINKEIAREWVVDLPNIVKYINKHYSHDPPKDQGDDVGIRGHGRSLEMLPEGTLVRYQLDHPVDATGDKKLHGSFRVGDIRFSKQVLPITQIYLRPNAPITYKVGDNGNVAYTRNQLQIVSSTEKLPPKTNLRKFIIEKIIKKFKGKKGLIYYNVQWNDGSSTDEPRKVLIDQVPNLVQDYEDSLKE